MTDLTALQAALAGEHATVYAYGVAGAHLRDARRRAALQARDAHLARRDRLTDLVIAAGEQPVAAEPAYALPEPVEDAAGARRLAATVEERLAATYADLVAAADGDLRSLAATALQEAAVRAATWRGHSVGPFPGLPERS
jgi:hypothetical protein